MLTAGDASYQYDLDGFLTAKTKGTEITTYDYSSRGELLGVTLPDGRNIEYVHDPLGRRIAKKVGDDIVEKYLWQGLTRLLAVYDGADNLLMRFEYADARMPFAMTMGGALYYLAYDQVGTLKAVADSSGNVIKRIEYDTFGNIISDSNAAFAVPFGFAGGLYDRDTGLVRFGYRDYDPETGRWTAKDPIGFAGGDTDLYGYCVNDPINLIDPTGESFDNSELEKFEQEIEQRKREAIRFAAQLGLSFIFDYIMTPGIAGKASAPKRVTNPKHHPNSACPEPKNAQELFDNSIVDSNGVRWAEDSDGTIHRFSKPSNGESHWNGSAGGIKPIRKEDIPISIRKALNIK